VEGGWSGRREGEWGWSVGGVCEGVVGEGGWEVNLLKL
jgi:hypothetical protein